MELISKISKGSRMDQVYIPKNREGFSIGSYVILKPLEIKKKKTDEKLYFYNTKEIEPIKLGIIEDLMASIEIAIHSYENIIITGSFLERGFYFNDIDILVITNEKKDTKNLQKTIWKKIKIKTHIILIDNKTLIQGLTTDPIYQMMLSKCISKKRFIYRARRQIDYKILDLHLLKSKSLIENFDMLTGNEKYTLTRNMIAITLFLQGKKIGKEEIDREIEKEFNIKKEQIKQNILEKKDFLKKYKIIYEKTLNKILQGIKDGTK